MEQIKPFLHNIIIPSCGTIETYMIAAIFYPFAPNAYIISYEFHKVISPGSEGLKQFLRRVIQYTEWYNIVITFH